MTLLACSDVDKLQATCAAFAVQEADYCSVAACVELESLRERCEHGATRPRCSTAVARRALLQSASSDLCTQSVIDATHQQWSSKPATAQCYFASITTTNVNSTLIATKDCKDPNCLAILVENQQLAAAYPSLDCKIYDVVTKQTFTTGDMANFCNATTTAATTTTAAPTKATGPNALCSQEVMDLNYRVWSNITAAKSCYFASIADPNFDSTRLLATDCKDATCYYYLVQNEAAAKKSPNTDCRIYDTATQQTYLTGQLASLCTAATTTSTTTATPSKSQTSKTPTTTTTAQFLTEFTPSPAPTTGSSNTGMITGIVAGVVAVVLLAGLFICMKKRKQHKPEAIHEAAPYRSVQDESNYARPRATTAGTATATNASKIPSSNGASTVASSQASSGPQPTAAAVVTMRDLEKDMIELSLHRIDITKVHLVQRIAEGAYGQVWLGEYLGDRVAVKKLLANKASHDDIRAFAGEINLLSKIECPFIVHFVGVAWTKLVDMMLVTEYMDRGDLRHVLQSKQVFPWHAKLQCALDIAEGLVYLHTMDAKIIHRDLKSRNILLDSKKGAKITDFGIAREADDFATLTLNLGTYRWMAPEVLKDGHYSESADLFSFGVILSELDTGILPYSDLTTPNGRPYTDLNLMQEVTAGRLLPTFSQECPTWFYILGRQCLSIDPTKRPTAMQVAFIIRNKMTS
ncbi:hypothetical protein AeMF1_006640 [Aphanomyces euteiches]|nr:hypothetical protein AeMF1_006640 [Aphanomyces euteiches]KAH9181824.1 hypothetical protein AeNC1_016201 [Aphanomyces euteiches]